MTAPYNMFPNAYGNPAYTQPVAMRDPYIPQAPQVPQQQMQNNNYMIWVQGEEGMKSYQVGPNVTVPLWDSENQTIYLKSTDSMGRPTVKYIDYTVRDESKSSNETNVEYVTKNEFNRLYSQLSDIANQLKQLKSNKGKRDDNNG
jgi:hypothetical protein